jgi:hypothetical protein
VGITKVQFDVAAIEAKIRQVGERSVKGGLNVMREEGDRIVDLAREYAPYDEGKLEAAIERNDAEERDDNRRAVVQVWVNPERPGSGGLRVGEYAYLMHEGLGPYGDGTYRPGPGTRDKQDMGMDAGGKYFERAIRRRAGELGKKLAAMYRRMFK